MLSEEQRAVMSKSLGPLELQVMEILWEEREATVQQVLEKMPNDKEYAYTTIMTIMSRLFDKGILMREQSGRSYTYKPASGAEKFLERLSSQAIHDVLNDYGDLAIAQFVDAVSADTEKLDQLKELIQRLETGEPK